MKHTMLTILLVLTATSAFARNATLRCAGREEGTNQRQDLFFYDGEVVTMIGGGTENMYVPFKEQAGSGKVFENKAILITIAKNNVTIEKKRISTRSYVEVSCVSTGE